MSSRFLVIVWVFVVLILTSSYSANLTSTKTISRMQLNHQMVFGGSTTSMTAKLGSINAVEAYAQLLRDGTLNHVINEIPYLSILIGNYPNDFVMTDRVTNTNGFGFVCTLLLKPLIFSPLFGYLFLLRTNLCLPLRCSRKVRIWFLKYREKSRS